jgi:hypothetical protein
MVGVLIIKKQNAISGYLISFTGKGVGLAT